MEAGNEQLLTIAEVAVLLRVSKWSVYQLIWSGQLSTLTIGRRVSSGLPPMPNAWHCSKTGRRYDRETRQRGRVNLPLQEVPGLGTYG